MNVFCRSMALPSTGSSNTAMGNANVSLAEGIDSDSALMKTKACFTLRESFCARIGLGSVLMTCQKIISFRTMRLSAIWRSNADVWII
jgi:hypothetical protein